MYESKLKHLYALMVLKFLQINITISPRDNKILKFYSDQYNLFC